MTPFTSCPFCNADLAIVSSGNNLQQYCSNGLCQKDFNQNIAKSDECFNYFYFEMVINGSKFDINFNLDVNEIVISYFNGNDSEILFDLPLNIYSKDFPDLSLLYTTIKKLLPFS